MTADRSVTPSRFDFAFYALVRNLLFALSKLLFRVQVVGREHIPKSGPFIAAPVHRSNLDTPIVGSVIARHMRFMGKAALWSTPASAWLFSALGGFPVDRHDNPAAAVRRAMRLAEAGESLAMFPEGTRRSGHEIGELQDGVAFISVRYQVPIVPIGVAGTEAILPPNAKFPKFKKVVIVIGPPLAPRAIAVARGDRKRAIEAVNDQLRSELKRLYDDAQARLR